jgi:transposase
MGFAMPKPYSLDLRERVVGFVEDGHSRRAAASHFKVSVSLVVNLMKAVRTRASFAPKPLGERRRAKFEPHRAFLVAQVAERADITMPELAGALTAATGERADPASLSRWLIRAGYRFKRRGGPFHKTLRASGRLPKAERAGESGAVAWKMHWIGEIKGQHRSRYKKRLKLFDAPPKNSKPQS